MYKASLIQKEKTEKLLKELVCNHSDISVIVDRVKSTPILLDEKKVIEIYYRKDAIRVNIDQDNGMYYLLYKHLLDEGVVYQKDTANPLSTDGQFAFFVDDKNIKYVFERFLRISED